MRFPASMTEPLLFTGHFVDRLTSGQSAPTHYDPQEHWGGRAWRTSSCTTFILITWAAGGKQIPLSAPHSGLGFLAMRVRNLPGVIRYSLLSGLCQMSPGEMLRLPLLLWVLLGPLRARLGGLGVGPSPGWFPTHSLPREHSGSRN